MGRQEVGKKRSQNLIRVLRDSLYQMGLCRYKGKSKEAVGPSLIALHGSISWKVETNIFEVVLLKVLKSSSFWHL